MVGWVVHLVHRIHCRVSGMHRGEAGRAPGRVNPEGGAAKPSLACSSSGAVSFAATVYDERTEGHLQLERPNLRGRRFRGRSSVAFSIGARRSGIAPNVL